MDADKVASIFAVLVVSLIPVVVYMFPALVAYSRGHRNTRAITVLNLFTGWTFIGWVASLVWAVSR